MPKPEPMASLAGQRVLVVEDDYVIATEVVDMLSQAGALPIGPLGWEADALAVATDWAVPIDLAILDVDLHGMPSYRVADALLARGIPLVFTTGFSAEAVGAAYHGYPRLEKPVSERALLRALRTQA